MRVQFGADAAEVGQGRRGAFGGVEAVDGLGEHQRQRVLSRSARPGQDQRLRKALAAMLSRSRFTVAELPRKF